MVASGAEGVAVVSSAMTTEGPLEATEEASRTEGEAAVEEATTEEVRQFTHSSAYLLLCIRVGLTAVELALKPAELRLWAELWWRIMRNQSLEFKDALPSFYSWSCF